MTTHELASILSAGPCLPVYHLDPSCAGLASDRDTSISEVDVVVQRVPGTAEGEPDLKYVTLTGSQSLDYEVEANRANAQKDEELRKFRAAIHLNQNREELGRLVRQRFTGYMRWLAHSHKAKPKLSHVVAWDQLGEYDREADRQIGELLFELGYTACLQEMAQQSNGT